MNLPRNDPMNLSLILPAKNESAALGPLLTRLRDRSPEADLIVLDCMGYGEQHRAWVRAAAGKTPVVVARSLVARLVAEAVEA